MERIARVTIIKSHNGPGSIEVNELSADRSQLSQSHKFCVSPCGFIFNEQRKVCCIN
ncbi:MAG: hypothetical protein ABIP98_02580 [Ginsengibacter sp.]